MSFQTRRTLVHPKTKITPLFNSFFSSVSVFDTSWIADVTWTILSMSLLPFWALNVSVALLSLEGQRALRFHQKYLNLCFKDEPRSYGFGTTWGWVIKRAGFWHKFHDLIRFSFTSLRFDSITNSIQYWLFWIHIRYSTCQIFKQKNLSTDAVKYTWESARTTL